MNNSSKRTLVNFIPISAPATRRPAMEKERRVRASIGFVPQWFFERLPIKFGIEWHENCEYRYDTLVMMKALLNEKFPTVPEFTPRDGGHGFDPDCATLSGVYGSKVLAMIYGFDVCFPDNDWPVDSDKSHIPEQILRNLEKFDLDMNPIMQKIELQMSHMELIFGKIEGYINYQGVLNTALKLRGNDIFYDMIDDESFVIDLFTHIAETTEQVAKRIQQRQRQSGVDINLLSLSNCVVNMISPEMYSRYILPHDERLSHEFMRFGIHTCNWDVTPYLSAISIIQSLGYLDMGAMSNLALARRTFPETRLAILVSPLVVQNLPLNELEKEFRRIVNHAAPCDLVLADLTQNIDDNRLNEVLQIISKLDNEVV